MDSLRTAASKRARPVAATLPPVTRPEGIRQVPRPKDLPEKVHVLLTKTSKPLSLYSLGQMEILGEGPSLDPKADAKAISLTRLTLLRGRFIIRRQGTGFAISQAGKDIQATTAHRLRLISVSPYNLIEVAGTVYRGGLHILAEGANDIEAVNVVNVEDYLRGVLPYELGTVDREALEALKALAVVARTYVYKRMLQHPGPVDFQVYSDVSDQVYKGVKGEYLLSDRAVWETRGMAVTYGDSLAQCYYFSTCGGRTAGKHEVWGGDSIPYLVSRPDTDAHGDNYCAASKYSSWSQDWSLSQLTGIVKHNLRAAGVTDAPAFNNVTGLEVLSRGTGGRIHTLRINTDKGPILVKGDKVRWALRPSANDDKILPSAWFDIKVSGNKVTAAGRAFGHGVGLCQVGAIGRARANQNFMQIVQAYYAGATITEFR